MSARLQEKRDGIQPGDKVVHVISSNGREIRKGGIVREVLRGVVKVAYDGSGGGVGVGAVRFGDIVRVEEEEMRASVVPVRRALQTTDVQALLAAHPPPALLSQSTSARPLLAGAVSDLDAWLEMGRTLKGGIDDEIMTLQEEINTLTTEIADLTSMKERSVKRLNDVKRRRETIDALVKS